MAPAPFDTPLAEATFVVFDFETTGLDPRRGARLVEIGAFKLTAGRVTDHLLTLVDPETPIPAEATAIHGLTDADVASGPRLAEAFPRFVTFAADAVLVAHNLSFDWSFVVASARELGLPPLPHATVDLLGLARQCYPGLDSYRLANLARALDVTNPAPHRSWGDVAVESQIFLAFLAAAGERGEAETVGDLVLLSRGLPREGIPAEAIPPLEWAAAAREAVSITYFGIKGESARSITPSKIKGRGGRGYVVAYCHHSRARREFRLDRLRLTSGG